MQRENREASYNAEIARVTYECMEFWRELLLDGYTAKQAMHLQVMIERMNMLRVERAYPPYRGPQHD